MQAGRIGTAGAALVVAMAIAACGGDDTSTTTSTTAAGATTTAAAVDTAVEVQDAAKLGRAAAGDQVTLEPKVVGVLEYVGATEIQARFTKGGEVAAKMLGWKQRTADAQGDPQKGLTGLRGLVSQGANGIISTGLPVAILGPGLKQARSKDIPAINIASPLEADPGLISATYSQDELELEQALQPVQKATMPEGAKVAMLTTPTLGQNKLQDDEFARFAKENGWTITDRIAIDVANLQQGAQTAVKAALTKTPDLDAVWVDQATFVATAAQVLRAENKCGDVLLFGQQDDLINLDAMRDGCVTALSSISPAATTMAAYDQFAQHYTRDVPIDGFPLTKVELAEKYGVDFLEPIVITKDNLPPKGEYATYPVDAVEFFKAKWAAEFGTGS